MCDQPDGGAPERRARRRPPGCSTALPSQAQPAPEAAMGHKPQIAVRDPFPGLPGARLARRRLLLLAGPLIDDLIVVATDEREIAVAAERGRRHGVAILVHAPTLGDRAAPLAAA